MSVVRGTRESQGTVVTGAVAARQAVCWAPLPPSGSPSERTQGHHAPGATSRPLPSPLLFRQRFGHQNPTA